MAKSLRSKWRRKCRAVKRERYDKKELERLKKTLTNDPAHKPEDAVAKAVEDNVIVFVDKMDIVGKNNEKSQIVLPAEVEEDENEACEMEVVSSDNVADKDATKDKNGGYPIWYSQRRIKAAKRTAKLRAGKIKKKTRR